MPTNYASYVKWGQNVTITDISWRQKGACQG
ncbi:MAG: hypothetical protein RLZZ199_464, partial [Actinomycetota bacterium]